MKDGGDVDVLDVRSIRVGQALLKQFGLSGALLPRYIRGPADLHGEMWGLRQCTQLTYILIQSQQHLPYTCQFNAIFLNFRSKYAINC